MAILRPTKYQIEQAGRRIALNKKRVLQIAEYASIKAKFNKKRLPKVWDDLMTFTRLLRAWAKGEYTAVPWRTVALVAGAVFYFLNPFDLIPDFLVQIGFLDDIAVLGAVLRTLGTDLKSFRKWEEHKNSPRQIHHSHS